jgi:hypothetical protein
MKVLVVERNYGMRQPYRAVPLVTYADGKFIGGVRILTARATRPLRRGGAGGTSSSRHIAAFSTG